MVASQIFNLLGLQTDSLEIVVGVAVPLFLVSLACALWVLWRWYDRQPDGRRGE